VVLPVTALAAGIVSYLVAADAGLRTPVQRWQEVFGRAPTPADVPALLQVIAWLAPFLLVFGATMLAAALAAWMLGGRRRRPPRWPGTGAVWLLAAVCAGVPTLLWHLDPRLVVVSAGKAAEPVAGSRSAQERAARNAAHLAALMQAGGLVRSLARPDDVVATNRAYVPGPAASPVRDNREFVVSAVTGLRTEVSGYGYTGRNLAAWDKVLGRYERQPFWDQARLRAELDLVTRPSAPAVADAYRRGVRWIVADETFGPVSPALEQLTDPVFQRDRVHVYRLPAP
jgi:hypothetical protein